MVILLILPMVLIDRFARCKMRMEKVSARVMSGCNQAVLICLTLTEVVEILWLG